MRIVKQRAVELLALESRQIQTQCQRCERLANRLASCYLGGMSGKSVTAAEQRIRMQAAAVMAQVSLLQSVGEADRHNAALVEALPTTSPGVLDTQIAQERLDEAKASITRFDEQMKGAVSRAEQFNAALQASDVALSYGGTVPGLIDVCKLRAGYRSLIAGQEAIVSYNERILEQAQRYEEQSAALYQGVDTAIATHALESMQSFSRSGMWGDVSWAGKLRMDLALASARSVEAREDKPILERFLDGELSASRSVVSGKEEMGSTLAGIPLRTTLSGELLGATVSLKPYQKSDTSKGDDNTEQKSASVGVEAEASGYVAQGKMTMEAGIAELSAKASVLTGSVTGTLGASLYNKGSFAPSATAKAEAKASVLSGEVANKVGVDGFDYHTKAKGSFATGKAEAGFSYGPEGFEAKWGSEAYVATGELSTGITVLGVKVDAVKEAKVAGQGVTAGLCVTPTSMEGRLGAGLGLGAGVKVKVDWSGLTKTLKRLGATVSEWWPSVHASSKAGSEEKEQ